MTTALITIICICLALALFAGAFYMAKYVVNLQHRVNVLEDSYKEAEEHIMEQEKQIVMYQQEMDYMRREAEVQQARNGRNRIWHPDDPLNINERR